MPKVLYFTDDFSPENIAKAKDTGVIMRDTRAYNPDDFIETCDGVTGDVPDGYKHLPKHSMKAGTKKDKAPKMPEPATVDAVKKALTDAGVAYDDDADEVTLRALYDEHNLYPVQPSDDTPTIDEMKAEMTEAGHDFDGRLGDTKITEIYNAFKGQ